MNKIYSTLLFVGLLFFSVAAQAQVNRGFSFQGYARTFEGAPLTNQSVEVRFGIHPPNAIDDYQENQTITTDAYGVFQLFVGAGGTVTRTVTKGVFNNINFAGIDYWLKVEVKSGSSSYATISDAQLQSVPYAKVAEYGVPAGTILPYAGGTVPSGFLLCDGKSYSQASYPNLFAAIGVAWGKGASDFQVPDLRGAFLRGVDGGRGLDSRRNERISSNGGNSGDRVGSYQEDDNRSHIHDGSTNTSGNHNHSTNTDGRNNIAIKNFSNTTGSLDNGGDELNIVTLGSLQINNAGDHSHPFFTNSSGSESRPKNYAVNYIIKF